jgi:hypothetical protein
MILRRLLFRFSPNVSGSNRIDGRAEVGSDLRGSGEAIKQSWTTTGTPAVLPVTRCLVLCGSIPWLLCPPVRSPKPERRRERSNVEGVSTTPSTTVSIATPSRKDRSTNGYRSSRPERPSTASAHPTATSSGRTTICFPLGGVLPIHRRSAATGESRGAHGRN